MSASHHPTLPTDDDEKLSARHQEHTPHELETAFEAGKAGHAIPVDNHGHALVDIDSAIERRVRRKLDMRLIPVLFVLYTAAFLDRTNIGAARLAGLERDLGMAGTDFNLAASVFFISYIIFELPSQLLSKVYGPHLIIPAATIAFGVLSMCCAFVHNLAQLCGVRLLLGIAEAPAFPGIVFYLSRFYRKDEVATRFALCIVSAPLAGAFGGLLAAAILNIDSIGWLTRWRNIFFLEGLATVVLAIAAFWLLPRDIDAAAWLSEEEKAVANARIKAENAGTVVVIEKARGRALVDGLSNINSLVCAFLFFWVSVAVQTCAFFAPTLVRQLFPQQSTIQQQLLTAPPFLVGGIFEVFIAYVSERTRNRAWPFAASGALMIVGYSMFIGSADSAVGYAAVFISIMGSFPGGVFASSWAAANQGTDSSRATAIGIVVFAGNCGGLVGTWTVLNKDAPRFLPAQAINVTAGCVVVVGSVCLLYYQKWENKQRDMGKRDHRIEGKSEDELAVMGRAHPNFRYHY